MTKEQFDKEVRLAAMAELEDTWNTDYETLLRLFVAGAEWARRLLNQERKKIWDSYEEICE